MAKPDWITLQKSSGTGNDTVQIICSPNSSSSQRKCTLSASTEGGGEVANLTITQIGLQPTSNINIKKESYITWECNYEGMTEATAKCWVVYNSQEYLIFEGNLMSGTPSLENDIKIPWVEGEKMSFKAELYMQDASGPAAEARTTFEVFANGEEIIADGDYNGAYVGATWGEYSPTEEEDITLEFVLSVRKQTEPIEPSYPDAFSFNQTEFTEVEGSFSNTVFSLPCSKTISSIAIEGGTNAATYFTQIVLTVVGPNAEQVFIREVTGAQLPTGQAGLLIKSGDYARITLLMSGEATTVYKSSSLTLKFGFTDGSSQDITFSFIGSLQ